MEDNLAKKAVGYHAAELVESGMLLGIGTGSTVHYFIERLVQRVQDGLNVKAVFSSKASENEAAAGGIFPVENSEAVELDLTVDGADEISPFFDMIKGGGGALMREKIIATASKQMYVIVDESKCVKQLGKAPLPLEIIPFCFNSIIKKINELGFFGTVRRNTEHDYFITDNGNYIYDLNLDELVVDAKATHELLVKIPGVVETGLFFDVASRLFVGSMNGKVREVTNVR